MSEEQAALTGPRAPTPNPTSGDFRDDGGSPRWRAQKHAEAMRPVWAVIRFVWLFPLVGTGALFFWFVLWAGAMLILGAASVHQFWYWLPIISFGMAWEKIVRKGGGFGVGRLDFRAMTTSPSFGKPGFVGGWGVIATLFRSTFVWAYAGYSIFFWFMAGVVLWAWLSGSWAHAMAMASTGSG